MLLGGGVGPSLMVMTKHHKKCVELEKWSNSDCRPPSAVLEEGFRGRGFPSSIVMSFVVCWQGLTAKRRLSHRPLEWHVWRMRLPRKVSKFKTNGRSKSRAKCLQETFSRLLQLKLSHCEWYFPSIFMLNSSTRNQIFFHDKNLQSLADRETKLSGDLGPHEKGEKCTLRFEKAGT